MSVVTTPVGALPNHSRSLWRSRLGSALRTAIACAIVGITTLYAPTNLRSHYLKFPAFSYVTAVLIVGDATLGESLRGAVCALYGTVLGLLPAVLTLYLMQPEGLSVASTAIAVSLSSFVVAISDSTGLITKRIALGQIVIVYVTAFKQAGHVNPVLHPVPVAASTAVGAVASVLALVLPYPRLACYEVREKSKLHTEITMERLRLLVNAFCADSSSCMAASICQAKSLTGACRKLLQKIKLMQGSMKWERPPFKFLPPHSRVASDTLQAIETPLKGMEIALASITSYPIKILDQQHKDSLISLTDSISIKLGQDNLMTKQETLDKTLPPFHVIPQNLQDLPSFFFVFCLKLLHDGALTSTTLSLNSTQDNKVTPTTEHSANSCKEEEPSTKKTKIKSIRTMNLSTKRVVIALKCSLSLGLAVLFGVLFSNNNGHWAGLTIAIAFTPWRDATFKLASVRAHGTALGSVYGVLGSLISQNLMEVRLLVLLPWIVFTSFLRRSRMYGQGGAIAATISAMIILGRRNYGSPMIFSIDRLTETYIGLCCSIFVELLLQPTRASTLARNQLSGSLHTVHECIESLTSSAELKEMEKKLRKRVNELRKYIGEAEVEPNFWFQPFPIACYNKLHSSLSKMADLVLFLVHSMELLVQDSHGIHETIRGDLDHFKELVGSSVKCFEEVIQIKSLAKLKREWKRKSSCNDMELGKGQSQCGHRALSADEEECERVVDSFLQHAKEGLEKVDVDVSGELKSLQVVLCLATFGFCIGELMRETREIEKEILELVQWENPSNHINLYEISCKIKEVST